jgi:predicted transposase YdaD
MFSEIGIYAYRQRSLFSDWRAVVIYPSRDLEQPKKQIVDELLASGRITPIYLGEMPRADDLPIGLGLMILTTLEGDEAKNEARRLIGQADGNSDIIGLVSTIVLYKFNSLSRDEVDMMLGIELQQTRVYQEAKAEGEVIGENRGLERERALVFKLLTRKLVTISPEIETRVNSLTIEQIESLGEALLDFTQIGDLTNWLDTYSS